MKNYELKTGDKIKVRIYGTDGKAIKTRNFDEVFTVCEESGKLGIYWAEDFTPFKNFCNTKFIIVDRTYQQDLATLKITSEEFENVISNIYDKTDDEMISISKVIKSGADVLPVVQRALERVLNMRATERQEAYNYHYNF